jgi:hypothetical protein
MGLFPVCLDLYCMLISLPFCDISEVFSTYSSFAVASKLSLPVARVVLLLLQRLVLVFVDLLFSLLVV